MNHTDRKQLRDALMQGCKQCYYRYCRVKGTAYRVGLVRHIYPFGPDWNDAKLASFCSPDDMDARLASIASGPPGHVYPDWLFLGSPLNGCHRLARPPLGS